MANWRLRLLPYLCLFGGVILTGGGFFEWRAEARLVAEGKLTRGRVVDRTVRRGVKGSKSHVLDVVYESIGGKRYRKEFKVPRSVYDSTGETVDVRYLPSDPARSRIGAGPAEIHEMFAVGIILAAIGAVWLALRRRRRRRLIESLSAGGEGSEPPWEDVPPEAPSDDVPPEPRGFLTVSLRNNERREFPVRGKPDARLILEEGLLEAEIELDFHDRTDDEEAWDTLRCRTRMADRQGTPWQCEALFLADELVIDFEGETLCPLGDGPLVRLTEAPAEWVRAFERDLLLGGIKVFRDDRTYATLPLSGSDLEIPIKYFAPRLCAALLQEGTGAKFLVSISGVLDEDGDEVPPFVYALDATKLLFRATAGFDADDGWWTRCDPRPVELEKLEFPTGLPAQPHLYREAR